MYVYVCMCVFAYANERKINVIMYLSCVLHSKSRWKIIFSFNLFLGIKWEKQSHWNPKTSRHSLWNSVSITLNPGTCHYPWVQCFPFLFLLLFCLCLSACFSSSPWQNWLELVSAHLHTDQQQQGPQATEIEQWLVWARNRLSVAWWSEPAWMHLKIFQQTQLAVLCLKKL